MPSRHFAKFILLAMFWIISKPVQPGCNACGKELSISQHDQVTLKNVHNGYDNVFLSCLCQVLEKFANPDNHGSTKVMSATASSITSKSFPTLKLSICCSLGLHALNGSFELAGRHARMTRA